MRIAAGNRRSRRIDRTSVSDLPEYLFPEGGRAILTQSAGPNGTEIALELLGLAALAVPALLAEAWDCLADEVREHSLDAAANDQIRALQFSAEEADPRFTLRR